MSDEAVIEEEVVEEAAEEAVDAEQAEETEADQSDPETEEAESEDEADEEAELLELEVEGVKYEIPKALEGHLLRQQDYTKKTQEVADQRRAVEEETAAIERHREAFKQQVVAHETFFEEAAELRAVALEVQKLKDTDWDQLQLEDPDMAQRNFQRFTLLRERQNELSRTIEAKQREATEQAQQETAKRLKDAREYAAREIDGWSDDLEVEIAKFSENQGVSADEIRQVVATNPAALKILNLARIGHQLLEKQRAAKVPKPKPVTPVTKVSGGTTPAKGPRDSQSIDAWMAARNKQVGVG